MISKEEVLNLAALARLKLSDEDVVSLGKDISSILEYVGQVNAVSAVAQREKDPLRNVMREDVARGEGDPLWGKEEALRAAFPQREGDYNVVRKIIQKDE